MIPTLLSIAAPVAIMIACGVLGGYREGLADARTSIANEEVEHKWSAWFRVITAAFIALCIVVTNGLAWWLIAPLALIGLSAFNPVLRWTMNRKRGMNTWYLSAKNWYDRQFIVFYMRRAKFGHGWIATVRNDHDHDYKRNYQPSCATASYCEVVDRAGRLAYIVELSCLITSALLYGTGVILSNN